MPRDSCSSSYSAISLFTGSTDGCGWYPHGACIRVESEATVSLREMRNAFWCSHAHITLISDSLGLVRDFARGRNRLGFLCLGDAMTWLRRLKNQTGFSRPFAPSSRKGALLKPLKEFYRYLNEELNQ